MNKQINKVKLAITTRCNLGCDYCFVKKTNQDMDWNTTENAIHLLLESEGKDKLLSIYGGEPLINFDLIKKICPYAASQAGKFKKNLIISVCTNATLLEKRHLDFFEKHGVRLIISLVGKKQDHNKFRGSYEKIVKILPIVFKKIPQEFLGVSFCLFPSTVERMEENFKHLIKLGFNNINFEVIHYYQNWSKSAQEKFKRGLDKIIKLVFNNIPKGNFVFLNPVNWEIKYQKISQSFSRECPFGYRLETYPSGAMAFSPFLLNSPDKEKYIIGNVNQNFFGRFKTCQYNPKGNQCRGCLSNYFSREDSDKGVEKIYEVYRILCLKAAKEIKNRASKDKMYAQYVRKIEEEVCF